MAGKAVGCELLFNNESDKWQMNELAFYMSQLHIGEGNRWDRLTFATDSPVLHLVRLDKISCTAEIPTESTDDLTPGRQLSFTMGVPFSDNHNNPVTQPWPLNVPDMFWTWRNGYKFLRIDMQSQTDAWAYHLGSVGCVSASAVRGPEKECAQPNRTRHSMVVPDVAHWTLVLHLDRLIGAVQPMMTNRCVMHGDTEPACQVLFNNLGNTELPVFTLEPLAEGNH